MGDNISTPGLILLLEVLETRGQWLETMWASVILSSGSTAVPTAHVWPHSNHLELTIEADRGVLYQFGLGVWPVHSVSVSALRCSAELLASMLMHQHLPALQLLDLSSLDMGLDDDMPWDLANACCPALREVNLSCKMLTDAFAAELAKADWPALETLSVQFNHFTAWGIEYLEDGNWPLLENLYTYGNLL